MSAKRSGNSSARLGAKARSRAGNVIITGPRAPLSITFDETHTVMYVRVSHSRIVSTRELPDDVLADYDAAGDLVGFEVIGYQNGRAGLVLANIKRAFPKVAPALDQLRELVPA